MKPTKADTRIRILSFLRTDGKITVTIKLVAYDPEEIAGLAKRLLHGYGRGINIQKEIGAKLDRQVVDLYLPKEK